MGMWGYFRRNRYIRLTIFSTMRIRKIKLCLRLFWTIQSSEGLPVLRLWVCATFTLTVDLWFYLFLLQTINWIKQIKLYMELRNRENLKPSISEPFLSWKLVHSFWVTLSHFQSCRIQSITHSWLPVASVWISRFLCILISFSPGHTFHFHTLFRSPQSFLPHYCQGHYDIVD